MKLLIATPLKILLYDTDNFSQKLIRMGDGEYYGITNCNQNIYLSHSGINSLSLRTYNDYTNSITGYISFNGQLNSPKFTSQPHQIEFFQDHIVIANTGKNCISIIDKDFNVVTERYLTGHKWDINPDGSKNNHFNSVHFQKDSLWVVAHNNGKPSEIWELEWLTLKTKNRYLTKTTYAHNIWFDNDSIFICNSWDGSIYEVKSEETIWKAEEDQVITRGVGVTRDFIFVGRSEYGIREERRYSDGGFWVIDKKSLKTLDKIVIPSSGCTNELRLVNEVDYAHNSHLINQSMIEKVTKYSAFNKIDHNFNVNKKTKKLISIPKKVVSNIKTKFNR